MAIVPRFPPSRPSAAKTPKVWSVIGMAPIGIWIQEQIASNAAKIPQSVRSIVLSFISVLDCKDNIRFGLHLERITTVLNCQYQN